MKSAFDGVKYVLTHCIAVTIGLENHTERRSSTLACKIILETPPSRKSEAIKLIIALVTIQLLSLTQKRTALMPIRVVVSQSRNREVPPLGQRSHMRP
jgi:hypothetical protein